MLAKFKTLLSLLLALTLVALISCSGTEKTAESGSSETGTTQAQTTPFAERSKPGVISDGLWAQMTARTAQSKIKTTISLREPTQEEKENTLSENGISLAQAIKGVDDIDLSVSNEEASARRELMRELYNAFYDKQSGEFIEEYILSDGVYYTGLNRVGGRFTAELIWSFAEDERVKSVEYDDGGETYPPETVPVTGEDANILPYNDADNPYPGIIYEDFWYEISGFNAYTLFCTEITLRPFNKEEKARLILDDGRSFLELEEELLTFSGDESARDELAGEYNSYMYRFYREREDEFARRHGITVSDIAPSQGKGYNGWGIVVWLTNEQIVETAGDNNVKAVFVYMEYRSTFG